MLKIWSCEYLLYIFFLDFFFNLYYSRNNKYFIPRNPNSSIVKFRPPLEISIYIYPMLMLSSWYIPNNRSGGLPWCRFSALGLQIFLTPSFIFYSNMPCLPSLLLCYLFYDVLLCSFTNFLISNTDPILYSNFRADILVGVKGT